jgi:hypothetical protein
MATPEAIRRCPPRISYCVAPAMATSAAFYKESRMKLVGPAKPYRKSREEELREDHDGPDFDAAITGSRDA